MFVGVGIPIPILNEGLAKKTAIKNEDILTDIVDYSVPRRDRPILKQVSYKELESGYVEINGKKVKCSSLSSLFYARKIAKTLKNWINEGKFFLNPPAETLPTNTIYKPMKQTSELKFVKDFKRQAIKCFDDCNLKKIAEKIIEENMNHIVITDRENYLKGIVTSFDVTKAIAQNKRELNDIITKNVITTKDNEPIGLAARRMKNNNISALPVVDESKRVIGIITSEELM